jgi:hypothetical protein
MKNLPIGIQSFENLREENYLYVDKTKEIHKLITSGKVYFLSRPRRFGKSLLISTLEAIFKGEKSLFEGLYIYDQWDWTQQHPVIRIDWSYIKHDLPEEMEISMLGFIQSTAQKYGLTLTRQYASDCFSELIELLHQKTGEKSELFGKIKYWYNGYSWDGVTSVYNPFSTLLLFTENQFSDYWFASGTPTFLVNIIKERNDVKLLLEPTQMQSSGFDSFDYQTLDTKLLSFQTGYLTIKKAERSFSGDTINYTMGIPNEEVRRALTEHLLGSYAAYPMSNTGPMRDRMLHQLFAGDSQAFEQSLQEIFAHIPYQLHIPREAYYHSLFLLWLNMLGFDIQTEVSTDKGRIDAVWTWDERVVIAEIKYAEDGPTEPLLEEAFTQITERRYFEWYAGENRRIAFLAVAFAGKEIACRLKEWE